MKVQKLEDLKVFQKAQEYWRTVNALLGKREFQRDLRLRTQLSDAIDSVVSNVSEGFAQSTDRAFARYLYDAKASAAEARSRLWIAAERRYITREEFDRQDSIADEFVRMTVGLIKYLIRSGRRDRGVGLG